MADTYLVKRTQSYTGKLVNPLGVRPNDVDIIDIAHSLAMQCRWNGHTKEFYSVAQHSVLASYLVSGTLWMQMIALLHDAGEAYISDVITPMKQHFNIDFQRMEYTTLLAILKRYDIPEPYNITYKLPNDVLDVDHRLLATEYDQLMEPGVLAKKVEIYTPYDLRIIPLPPASAKKLFLKRFWELLNS